MLFCFVPVHRLLWDIVVRCFSNVTFGYVGCCVVGHCVVVRSVVVRFVVFDHMLGDHK